MLSPSSHRPWTCPGAAPQRGAVMSTSLLLPSSGQKSGASDHILLQLFDCLEPFDTGILFPTFLHHSSHFLFDRIIRDKVSTISRQQVKHCKFSSLLLMALCLWKEHPVPCRAMLRTIEDSSSQLFLLVSPAKENHPVIWFQSLQALKRFPRSLPWKAVSWFAEMVSVGASCFRLIVNSEWQLANCFIFERDLVYILGGTASLIAMCDKTTERFKRPSFSVIIKRREEHQSFATKKQNPTGYTLTINSTWGLGPKVFDTEKSPVFFAAAGEGGIFSPHTDSASFTSSWEDVSFL